MTSSALDAKPARRPSGGPGRSHRGGEPPRRGVSPVPAATRAALVEVAGDLVLLPGADVRPADHLHLVADRGARRRVLSLEAEILLLESPPCSEEQRFHRPVADAQPVGDVAVGQPLDLPEEKGRPLLRGQTRGHPAEAVARLPHLVGLVRLAGPVLVTRREDPLLVAG